MGFNEIDGSLEVKCYLSFSHPEHKLQLEALFFNKTYVLWHPLTLKGLHKFSSWHIKQIMTYLEPSIDSL